MMKTITLFLGILGVLISIIWYITQDSTLEPIVVFLLGVSALTSSFIIKKKELSRLKQSSESTNTNEQKVNVEVNINSDDKNGQKQMVENQKEKKLKKEDILEIMKQRTSVLFIDDEKFKTVQNLKDAGWTKTKLVADIKSLDIPAVKSANLYFVDINGVGKLMNCEYEGLDLALMLKERYPEKEVVIYSANKKQNSFHDAWSKCKRLEKTALPYQFQKIIEQFSIESYKR